MIVHRSAVGWYPIINLFFPYFFLGLIVWGAALRTPMQVSLLS